MRPGSGRCLAANHHAAPQQHEGEGGPQAGRQRLPAGQAGGARRAQAEGYTALRLPPLAQLLLGSSASAAGCGSGLG